MKLVEVPKIDVTKYIGEKVKTVSAVVELLQHGEVIKVITEPIELKDGDTMPEDKELTASILLGLFKNDDDELCIGKDTKAEKWLLGHKIDIKKLPDSVKVGDRIKLLEGLDVVCQKNLKDFLEIA